MTPTWRWDGGAPHPCPLDALAASLGFGVRCTVVHRPAPPDSPWALDATEVLRAFTRWCALEMADRWRCPDLVRSYLETGDEALHSKVLSITSKTSVFHHGNRTRQIGMDTARLAVPKSAALVSARSASQKIEPFVPYPTQAAQLEHMLHLEHQLQGLEPEFRALYEGSAEERAVLRDIALQRGLGALALQLRPGDSAERAVLHPAERSASAGS